MLNLREKLVPTISRRELDLRVEDHIHIFCSIKEHLMYKAMEVANSAHNYRDFNVGCAMLAWNPNATNYADVHKIFTGSNTMHKKGSHKICAEQIAMGNARSKDYSLFVGMVVAGIPQSDSRSGIDSKTLHPCGDCRDLFKEYEQVKPQTRIVTIDPIKRVYEDQSVENLLRIHGEL